MSEPSDAWTAIDVSGPMKRSAPSRYERKRTPSSSIESTMDSRGSRRRLTSSATEPSDHVRTRLDEQMEGVAEHDLEAKLGDLGRVERLDGAGRGERHEGGGADLAVCRAQDARAGRPVAGGDGEAVARHSVRLWPSPNGEAARRGRPPGTCVSVGAYFSCALPSRAGLPSPVALIATRRGLRSSGFGMWTSSTPRSNSALIASASTPSGRVSERLKLPNERSIRYQPCSRLSCSVFRSPEIVRVPSWTSIETSSSDRPGRSAFKTK